MSTTDGEGTQCVERKPLLWGSEEALAGQALYNAHTEGQTEDNDSVIADEIVEDEILDDNESGDVIAMNPDSNSEDQQNESINEDIYSDFDDYMEDFDDEEGIIEESSDNIQSLVCHWYDSKELSERASSSKLTKNAKQMSFGSIYQSVITVPSNFTVDHIAVLVNATIPRYATLL